ncbi:MAG: hypothetical protein CFE21_00220 [Bacteroidetes bacterium B1(2017)]|nr:MAG: hypothetical protein CFE21_00220 [Bacteroidetes bacterium B1(2017)]
MKIKYNIFEYYFYNKFYPLEKLINLLHRAFQGEVQTGIFKGLKLAKGSKWGNSGNKLLGTYEMELYPTIQNLDLLKINRIFDIGSAEGYYAIGMLKLIPNATLKAWEMDSDSRELLLNNSQLNSVQNRLEVFGKCEYESFIDNLANDKPDFIIIDTEGYELALLTNEVARQLINTTLLVETHSIEIQNILLDRFENTHQISIINNRDENLEDFKDKSKLPFVFRIFNKNLLRVINEGRPFPTPWFFMIPKNT